MSNGRGNRSEEKAKEKLKLGVLNRLKNVKAPKRNELDSYNKMVDKIGAGIQGAMSTADLGRILGAAPAAFRDRNKKPVLDSKGKPVKNLVQDRAGGGEVFDMTTEMEVNE